MLTLNAPSSMTPHTSAMIDEVLQNVMPATRHAEQSDHILLRELADKAVAPLIADGTMGYGKVLESWQALPPPRRNVGEKFVGVPESFAILQARLNRSVEDAEEIKRRDWTWLSQSSFPYAMIPSIVAASVFVPGFWSNLGSFAAGIGPLFAPSLAIDLLVVSRMEDELRPSTVKYALGFAALGIGVPCLVGQAMVGAASGTSLCDPKVFSLGLAALIVGGGLVAKALFEAKSRVDRTLTLGKIARKIEKNLPERITPEILAEFFKSNPMNVVSGGYARDRFYAEYTKINANLRRIATLEQRLDALKQKRVSATSNPAIPESFRDVAWIDQDLGVLSGLKTSLTGLYNNSQYVVTRLDSAWPIVSQSEAERLCEDALSLMKKIRDLELQAEDKLGVMEERLAFWQS